MTIYKEFSFGNNKSPFGSFVPIILMVLFFVALFFVAKGIFTLLSYAAPFLLLGALILDYTAVTDYLKFLWKLLKDNTLMGILAVAMTVIGFPIVSGFLIFRAYMRRTRKSYMKEQEKTKYIDYEEINTDEEDENFLILPERKKEQKSANDKYDNLFE